MVKKKIRIAIAGNPNSGKTTIFNNLTGARQRVGNYPGVTVEKKTGTCVHGEYELEIVDLPGTYNLTAWSLDEKVARDFIINERPDVVVDVVDSSNLERNLYLTTQLMELDVPLVLAFNMTDVAHADGISFKLDTLSVSFGAPIVPMVGHKNRGTADLLDAVVAVATGKLIQQKQVMRYRHDLEDAIQSVAGLVEKDEGLRNSYGLLFSRPAGLRWMAIKLLEQDPDLTERISSAELREVIGINIKQLTGLFGDSFTVLIADYRYGYIAGAIQEAVIKTVEFRRTASDMADVFITHPVLGMPIFMLMMYIIFLFTFKVGEVPMGWLEGLFGWVAGGITKMWPVGWFEEIRSLIVDGVIGGVGGVLVFLPNILILFFFIAVLEYSGYMARAAFVMDRLMHRIGLHGKSFIPMLIGFGCSVPAIMATRTLDTRRDRLVTMLIVPLMSCGARLPIYALIIPAFFPVKYHSLMLWLIYLTGIIMAILAAKLLGLTVFKELSRGLVIELPPYRMPTVKCVLIHVWERSWLYLRKAGTIILGVSVLMWVLVSYPRKHDDQSDALTAEIKAEQVAYSAAGRIGRFIEPALRPMGFDWRIGTALIGAIAAKEVFVSQLGVVYSLERAEERTESLRDILREKYTPLTGLCIMLFCLIGTPCAPTCAVMRLESGSWGWVLFQFCGLTILAYIVTTAVYQTGVWMGF